MTDVVKNLTSSAQATPFCQFEPFGLQVFRSLGKKQIDFFLARRAIFAINPDAGPVKPVEEEAAKAPSKPVKEKHVEEVTKAPSKPVEEQPAKKPAEMPVEEPVKDSEPEDQPDLQDRPGPEEEPESKPSKPKAKK